MNSSAIPWGHTDLWNEYYQVHTPDKRNYARDFVMRDFYGRDLIRTMDYWTTYPK